MPTELENLKARRDGLNRELMSLHLKISTAEQAAAPEHRCKMNGKDVITKGPCFGTHLRMQLSPASAGYSILMENTGNAPDVFVQDSDPIPNGARCYSIPPAWGA